MMKLTSSFTCANCGRLIRGSAIGTRHRNHCPYCLWSVHLDRHPGDRQSPCGFPMRPIGLTYKKQGELKVVHLCTGCRKVATNRIAGDDTASAILDLLQPAVTSPDPDIRLLTAADRPDVQTALFGHT